MDNPGTAIRLNPFKGLAGPTGTPVPWSPYGRILDQRPNFTLDPLYHAGCYYVQDSSAMFVGYLFRKLVFPGTDLSPRTGFGQQVALHPSQSKLWAPQEASEKRGPRKSSDFRGVIAEGGHASLGERSVPGRTGIRVLDLCAAPGGKTTDLAASLREVCGSGFTLVANEVMKARASVLRSNVSLWGDPSVVVKSVDPAIIGRNLPGWFDVIVADVPCSGEGMFRKDERARREWSPELVELCARRQRRILADVWPALRQGGILIYSTCTYETAENDDNLVWAAETLGGEIFPSEDVFTEYGVRKTPVGNLLEAGVVPGEGQWAGALRKTAAAPGSAKASLSGIRPLEADPADRALQIGFTPDLPVVELDRQTALRFLHRDALHLPDAPKGEILLAFEGHPLGFANNLGGRCNNRLPKGRRILMDVEGK